MGLHYLSIGEIRSKKYEIFYEVVLLDFGFDVYCSLGAFESLSDARIKSNDYICDNNIDSDFVEIRKYSYDEFSNSYKVESL